MDKDNKELIEEKDNTLNLNISDINLTIKQPEEPEVLEDLIPMSFDNFEKVEDVQYDKEEFKHGLDKYSFYAGALTALKNAGITSSEALEIIINNDTITHSQCIQKMTCENNIAVAKIQESLVNKNQL